MMTDTSVTVFHNPACGTSRKTIALLQENGIEPTIVEYLKVGWTRDQLEGLLKKMNASAHDILRVRGTRAEELGLTDPGKSDSTLIEAMVADPSLVNRPIVDSPKGAALCRPQDRVLELI